MKSFIKKSAGYLLVSVVSVMYALTAGAQQKTNFKVAIFIYQGVELLDFAGPGEVFASTPGFRVYTVSADGKDVLSQRFVTVKPEYSIDNAPAPDIIVFPGGSAAPSGNDPKVINWINKTIAEGNVAMSVCTGAHILAKAGLLENLNVTTFHGYISGLQEILPHSKVLTNTRFVDNGNIITTAGVSAGIDGALHLVSRIKGLDAAKATAFYMEYDKWKPEEGRADYKNPYLEQLKLQDGNTVSVNSNTPIPYEGELKNLSAELWDKGMYKEQQQLLEKAIQWYPDAASLYNDLTRVYVKLGKPAPADEETFMQMINAGKIDEAVAMYDKAGKDFPDWKIFAEETLNIAGYQFMQKEDYNTAIKIFLLNAKAYPKSFNVFDSLGESYLKAGNKKEALANYQKSLELNPDNTNAGEAIKNLL